MISLPYSSRFPSNLEIQASTSITIANDKLLSRAKDDPSISDILEKGLYAMIKAAVGAKNTAITIAWYVSGKIKRFSDIAMLKQPALAGIVFSDYQSPQAVMNAVPSAKEEFLSKNDVTIIPSDKTHEVALLKTDLAACFYNEPNAKCNGSESLRLHPTLMIVDNRDNTKTFIQDGGTKLKFTGKIPLYEKLEELKNLPWWKAATSSIPATVITSKQLTPRLLVDSMNRGINLKEVLSPATLRRLSTKI